MKYAFIVASLVFFVGCDDKPHSKTEPAQAIQETKYSKVEQWMLDGKHQKAQIAALHFDRDQNTLASEEYFKDKAVITTGIVLKVDKEITGLPYLLLRDRNTEDELQAVFPEYATSGLLKIRAGDTVTVAGEYSGRMIGLFMLKDCMLVDDSAEREAERKRLAKAEEEKRKRLAKIEEERQREEAEKARREQLESERLLAQAETRRLESEAYRAKQAAIVERKNHIKRLFRNVNGIRIHQGLIDKIAQSARNPDLINVTGTSYRDMGDYVLVECHFNSRDNNGLPTSFKVSAHSDLDGNISNISAKQTR